MTVERWTPPGPRGSNGSRLHGVLEYRPSLYRTSPFVIVFGVWLWEFSLTYKEYALFKRSSSYSKHNDKHRTLDFRALNHVYQIHFVQTLFVRPQTQWQTNFSLRVLTRVRPIFFFQTLFVIPQTQRQTKNCRWRFLTYVCLVRFVHTLVVIPQTQWQTQNCWFDSLVRSYLQNDITW